jgi:hypothetical protein
MFIAILRTRVMERTEYRIGIKVKVFPVQALKAYMSRRVTAPLILKLNTRCSRVVSLTSRPLPAKNPRALLNKRLCGATAGLDVWREKPLVPIGIRTPARPARSLVVLE